MNIDQVRDSVRGIGIVGPWALRLAKFFLGVPFRILPKEIVVSRRDIRYRLNTRDDIQQLIFLNAYESAELNALASLVRPGSICIDVGANIGFFTCHLARLVGPKGRVFAFEPDVENAQRLRDNVILNGYEGIVDIHLIALSSYSGSSTFYKSTGGHSGWGSLIKYADIRTEERVVQTETLDRFCAALPPGQVDLLKVDIEGLEFEFLVGANKMFEERRFENVLIEFNGPRLAEHGHSLDELLNYFTQRHYLVSDADHVANLDRVRAKGEVFNLLFSASR